jgi:lysozyme family protein
VPSPAFEAALPFILRWEGGFVDHPADPGGRTNKGITQRTYNAWRTRQGLAGRDVKLIEDAEVHAIYESGYWIPPRCDLLGQPLDLVQLDTAVNMGPGRAVRFLQQAAGCSVDGDFGPGTQRAVEACNPGDTVATYCNLREAFYRQIVANKPEQGVFLKGWMNRLNSLRKEVGLPGFESARELDLGDTDFIARVPDIGEDPSYDF